MSACCAGCTCGQPEPQPAVALVGPEVIDTVTEGWEMTGLASQRKDGPARSWKGTRWPVLRPIDGPVEWSARELRNGIAFIEVRASGDDADGDGHVKVLGADAKAVYDAWQRVAASVATVDWFYEVPF